MHHKQNCYRELACYLDMHHKQNCYMAIRLAEHCLMLKQYMLAEPAFAFVAVQIHNHIHNTVLIGQKVPGTK